MNNSSVCSYFHYGKEQKKKRYSTFEEAFEKCKKINSDPRTIYKNEPYKCTTCFYFHIGRTHKVLKHKIDIYSIQNSSEYWIATHKKFEINQEVRLLTRDNKIGSVIGYYVDKENNMLKYKVRSLYGEKYLDFIYSGNEIVLNITT